MALSRPIGWLRDQRGDAVGLATADPLFQGGETKPTGYVATYSPVFTAEQVQQEIKAARADAIARLEQGGQSAAVSILRHHFGISRGAENPWARS